MNIAIVGAGLAGLCAAKSLLDAGAAADDITVFERRAGPGLETSHANGALLHPSAVDPWNSPGIGRFMLANLGNEESPVLLRPSALPSLLGWGLRFLRESAPARHRAHTLANVALALRSIELMRSLRDNDGLDYGAAATGSLAIHRNAGEFAKARERAAWLREHGVPSRALDRDELVALEPALKPLAPTLAGAIHNSGDEAGDAYRFCLALAAHLEARGVAMRWNTAIGALHREGRGGAVTGVALDDGRIERFDAVVLAGAWWSVALARPLGLKLPIRPVKGYSLTLPLPESNAAPGTEPSSAMTRPRTPVIDHDEHIAVVPVGSDRLRVAGTAEFCGADQRIDPARIGNLMRKLAQVYPALAEHAQRSPRQEWTGLRPMCPDGKPLIGPTRIAGLFLNTGHGQLGWTTGAASGELLACAVTGRAAPIDAAPFLPVRFGQ